MTQDPGERGVPKVFRAYLPSTFDSSTVRDEWDEYAKWLVSATIVRQHIEKLGCDAFVPLSARFIDSHIPAKVRLPLLTQLQELGVLECDDYYFFGGSRGKCLCYRLGPEHRNVPLVSSELTHPELLRKLRAAIHRERAVITDPVHLALRAWHDRVEVSAAAPRGNILLDKMIDGERRFSVCEQGRLHTNAGNLPREFRQYLRINGEELFSCDIKNSQPLLLALLIKEERKETGASQSIYSHCNDNYLNDARDGSVYDNLVGETGLPRETVKQRFLAVIYGRRADMRTIVGKALERVYPGAFRAASAFAESLGHGGLPRKLQRMESNLMIRGVAARLLRENPQMPLLTVHDSVVVPETSVEYACRVIEDEWKSAHGVAPSIAASRFTAPQPSRKETRERVRDSIRPIAV